MTQRTSDAANGRRAFRTTTMTSLTLTVLATGCDDGLVEPPPSMLAPGQPMAAVVHAGDRDALVALYNATGGADWTHNDNWLSDEPLDEWYGVVVNGAGRVTGLHLRKNGLEGALPA